MMKDIAMSNIAILVTLTRPLKKKAIEEAPRDVRKRVKKNIKNLATLTWNPKIRRIKVIKLYLFIAHTNHKVSNE